MLVDYSVRVPIDRSITGSTAALSSSSIIDIRSFLQSEKIKHYSGTPPYESNQISVSSQGLKETESTIEFASAFSLASEVRWRMRSFIPAPASKAGYEADVFRALCYLEQKFDHLELCSSPSVLFSPLGTRRMECMGFTWWQIPDSLKCDPAPIFHGTWKYLADQMLSRT